VYPHNLSQYFTRRTLCSVTVMRFLFLKKGKQENVPPTSKVPVKERLGGGHPQKVLTQSQVPVILDEAAAKEATEAREKEREKVSSPVCINQYLIFTFFVFLLFQAVAAIKKSQEILAAKEALKKKQEEQKRVRLINSDCCGLA